MLTYYQSERLELHILKPDSSSAVLDFYERNRNTLEPVEPLRPQYFYTITYQSRNLTWEYNAFLKSKHIRYWMFRKNSNIPIGCVCFSEFQGGAFHRCMIGYKLDQTATGNGYMQEAIAFLLPLVAKHYEMHRFEAMVLPENESSIRLLEHLHFVREGYLHSFAQINGQYRDHLLYTYIVPDSSED